MNPACGIGVALAHERVERLRSVRQRAVAEADDVQRNANLCGGFGGVVDEELERHEQPRLRVAQVVADLGCLEQRVQRQHRHAGLEDSEVGDEELRHVRHVHRDHVTGHQAGGGEPARELARLRVQLGISRRRAHELRDRRIRSRQGRFTQDRRQVETHRALLPPSPFALTPDGMPPAAAAHHLVRRASHCAAATVSGGWGDRIWWRRPGEWALD